MRFRSGGIAAVAIRHPVGTVMISLATVVLGAFAVGALSVDLLPKLIYPEIRVRILDPGVPTTVMEDRITRQLEEQLAITEDATRVQSQTSEGSTTVNLSFPYGKDIDVALRDASTRLDRARRFLPTTIDPPIIFKLDPSQIPVAEFIVSSSGRDPVALRTWTDDIFAKQFLTLPGVAAVEVGGGLVREIHVLPEPQRLAALGLSVRDVIDTIRLGNVDEPGGRITLPDVEYSSRTAGRVGSLAELKALPLRTRDGEIVSLAEVAQVLDAHEDNRLRARFNDAPGVKITIQKQPDANTVAVVDGVIERLDWLHRNGLVPEDVRVDQISDQAVYVRNAIGNAGLAAVSGAVLAMIVVYLFLGNLRRTLIIGTAIPISVMVTFSIMGIGGLTLNIMSLGGLALGVGLLVDNTIVMLENISRHQAIGERGVEAGRRAAAEVTSAIVASTTTNLAAVLPFLFIGGLVGLLFQELIFTISAAILASMLVAITLVPALAARTSSTESGVMRRLVDRVNGALGRAYASVLAGLFGRGLVWAVILLFVTGLAFAVPFFKTSKQEFLPRLDDGRIDITVTMDTGRSVDEMDHKVARIEDLIWNQGYVDGVFTLVGGFIFGRTEREVSNQTTIKVQLANRAARPLSNAAWVNRFNASLASARIAGVKVRARPANIRGLRISASDEEISVRIQGTDLAELERLADEVAKRLADIPGLRNVEHNAEEKRLEYAVEVDRERAADLGVDVATIGEHVRLALQGEVVSDFLDGDRAFPIRVRIPRAEIERPEGLGSVMLFAEQDNRPPIYLRDVASVHLVPAPLELKRDNQRRIVEVTASPVEVTLGEAVEQVNAVVSEMRLPAGYSLYLGGAELALQQGRNLAAAILALALFLVFVVLAVQYESLRDPLIILICAPFALIGVVIGLAATGLPLSMPVWLGLIMLVGIVVNNSIVLVEYIEILRERGSELVQAVVEAGRLRLRPILMTTLTTVVGMLPLALGVGEGAEMLQPLAVTIVSGLTFAMMVSLLLLPAVYYIVHRFRPRVYASTEPPLPHSA